MVSKLLILADPQFLADIICDQPQQLWLLLHQLQCGKLLRKSRIRETLNLSMCADGSNNNKISKQDEKQ